MVVRDEDPFRLSRRVVTAGLLASGLVWAAHPIPVRVDPPGSPGTDPFAGSISFATVPGWWGVGAGVLVLGWVGLALVLAMAPRTRGWVESVLRVVGVVLGAALAISVVLPVATAVRVYLTGYGDPQLTSTLLVTWWAAASVWSPSSCWSRRRVGWAGSRRRRLLGSARLWGACGRGRCSQRL